MSSKKVLNEAKWLELAKLSLRRAAPSFVDCCEFKSACVRILCEREFVIAERSSFSWAAQNIERNSPASVPLAESALLVVRRIFCNEVDAVNIIIVISEDIN